MFYEAQLAFNEGGNDGFWRFQLRDKYGRWIKMGGSAMFEFRKPNDKNVYKAKGTFQGNIRRGASIIRVGEGEQLPPGDYEVDSRYIESIKAIINTTSAKPEIVDAPKSVNPDVEKQATEREMVAATVKDLEAGDIVQQSTEEALYGQINSVEHGDTESKINVTWSDGSNYDMTLPGDKKIKVWGAEPEGETVDAGNVEDSSELKVFEEDNPGSVFSWLNEWTSEGLTPRQIDNLGWYQQAGYRQINKHLRDNSYTPEWDLESVKNRIKDLDDIMSTSKGTPTDAILYRAVIERPGSPSIKIEDLRVGGILGDKAFMSTTSDINLPKKWLEDNPGFTMELLVPKGTKAIAPYARLFDDDFEDEYELILDRGSSIEITGINYETNTVTGTVLNTSKDEISDPPIIELQEKADEAKARVDAVKGGVAAVNTVGNISKAIDDWLNSGLVFGYGKTKVVDGKEVPDLGSEYNDTEKHIPTWEMRYDLSNEEYDQVNQEVDELQKEINSNLLYVNKNDVYDAALKNAIDSGLKPGKAKQYALGQQKGARTYVNNYNENIINGYQKDFYTKWSSSSPNAEEKAARLNGAEKTKDVAIKYLDQALPTIAIDSGDFLKAIKDGRLKSQFETKDSGGHYDPGRRTVAESGVLGIPVTTSNKNRPIYGYLTVPGLGSGEQTYEWNKNRWNTSNSSIYQYGSIQLVLKPEMRDKSTYTMVDSLDRPSLGFPLSGEHTQESLALAGFWRDIEHSNGLFYGGYTESQIHGGVKISDISEIVVEDGTEMNTLREALDAAGYTDIPVRVTQPGGNDVTSESKTAPVEPETIDAPKEDSIWGDAAPNERDVVAAAYARLPADMPVAEIAALDPDFATYPDSMKSDPASIKEVAIGAMQQLVRKWNGSSIYDDSTKVLHEVAREHFKIDGASPVELTEGSKALMENKEAYAAVLDAMYGATQEMFANAGIEEITVYRGSKTDSSGVRPLSSWTTSEDTAKAFAGSDGDTREMTVPVSQILSTSMSGGLGAWNEKEVVLLGPSETVDAPKPKSRFEPPTDPAEIEAMRVDAEKRAARMKELELEREARLKEEAEAEAKKADESYRMAQDALLKKDTTKKKKSINPGFKNWNNQIGKIFAVVDKKGEFGPRGDVMQATFIEKSGFNGKPQVLSQAEFDALEGETIYRGVTFEGMVTDYIESEVQYAGQGSFGNGTYNSNLKETAETYASGSGPDAGDLEAKVMEMKLLPDANVLLFEEVPELREWASQKTTEFLEGYKKSGANPAEYQEAEWKLFNEGDWTNIAIMLGIDAVRFKVPLTDKEEYYTITLNRGKVAINGKS
jgi:hypothetical protein